MAFIRRHVVPAFFNVGKGGDTMRHKDYAGADLYSGLATLNKERTKCYGIYKKGKSLIKEEYVRKRILI